MDLYGFIMGAMRQRGRWVKLLTSPLTYSLMGGALRLSRGTWPLEATYRMGMFACSETRRAFAGKVPVVWTSAFFPVELAWGLDLCPFSPEVAAAYLASLGLGEDALSQGEQAGYSRDLCSFHRCAAGAATVGLMPHPAALLASTCLCDGAPQLFQNMASLYNAPLLTLDLPYNDGPEAEDYVAGQLAIIWQALADATGRRPDRGRLAEAIHYSNRFRERICRVNELRRRAPAPISGNDMLSFIYLYFAGQGSRTAAEIAATLAAEVERICSAGVRAPNGYLASAGEEPPGDGRPGTPQSGTRRSAARHPGAPAGGEPAAAQSCTRETAPRTEKYRLLWLHLKPYYSNELMNFLEQSGAVLAFEEMDHVYWPPLDPDRPFLSLGRKVLSHFAYKPLAERIRMIRNLAAQYRVDGIVHFSHQGCRQSCGGSLMIKDALQEEGWPVLVLEGDCIDGRDDTGGSMLTRLQAFLEVLEERKPAGCGPGRSA
jgi:benzoyl-CoA reductase/2-hydroxyglutaryl-CoA dehydratase subunit BcrC/BadD/HgdB